MEPIQPNNPLHGVKLETIVTELVDYFDWDMLGRLIPINCFMNDPSIKSSLKFLRKTLWARKKVEELYLENFEQIKKNLS
ncbi:MAG TPA: transporter [Marinilabiliales bacterium]|jgi:uncharacterized protein (DUF2132 family)|nr:MAG: transporter [Bacteroidetes bacterium GWA2_40_14]OFX60412.1 MAG: transporter [Bacteroidetes bacterium GWC2_40_13]OFX72981.1 MAG: transporter [Bacteroidetes bacterium GWD2_40_43]OFX91874.1 MAG: transporter [Bacteroidetes bacterium GWE2_40_63]OFY19828.1 MAG: transporter [Bacteroidetes bacterium GWF2_40_13]OFZ28238.1 MAG: transporter [Bacteroidetes bacterium RIFOXYC2_FULL_40_12]HAM97918.1 transporter [Marinilabiliales bacterium]